MKFIVPAVACQGREHAARRAEGRAIEMRDLAGALKRERQRADCGGGDSHEH